MWVRAQVVTEAGAIECLVHVCVHVCEYMGGAGCVNVLQWVL